MSGDHSSRPTISLMLAVLDAPVASAWYERALRATVLRSLGSVVGLEIAGAPVTVASPSKLSVRR